MAMDNTDYAIVGRDQADPFFANRIRSGESTIINREDASTAALASTSQTLYLTYFTAKQRLTSTQISVPSGSTAAGATPTLVRFGLYSVDGQGNLTLIASTANDTTLLAAANTFYTKNWSASVVIHQGQRYALGVLVVTGAATPTFNGFAVGAAIGAIAPRLNAQVASQSDLPASIAVGSLANGNNVIYGEIRP